MLPKNRWQGVGICPGTHMPAIFARTNSGLTPARLRGIAEAQGSLLVFIDDDNIPAPAYLETAAAIPASNSHITVFGAGILEPEFEEEPAEVVRPWLGMLGIRTVSRPTWTNNAADYFCTPWGAGLCVPRRIAMLYSQIVHELRTSEVLDRHGRKSVLRWR